MPRDALRFVAAGIAVSSAWLAAPVAGFGPLLWLALLLAVLSVQPRERRLIGMPWGAAIVSLLAISWLVAADHESAFRISLLVLSAVLVFGLARLSPPTPNGLDWIALLVALSGFVAIHQAVSGLGEAGREVAAVLPSLRPGVVARVAIGRAFGTAALPGHFAVLMAMVAPLVVSRAWRERGWRRAPWVIAAVACAGGIVATRSLAALLALTVALTLVLGRRRWRLVLVGAAVALAAAAVVVTLRGDIGSLAPLRLRWINWSTAAWVFGMHPLTGVGLGGVGQAGLASPYAAANISPFAHCTPLQLAAELGFAGAVTAVLAGGGLIGIVRRGLRFDPVLALAVVVVPLHNLVDFSLYTPEVLLPWCVFAGALAARAAPPVRRAVPALALVPVLVCGALAATAQWRGETEVRTALLGPAADRPARLLAAAAWQPWAVTPVLAAAQAATTGSPVDPALNGRIADALERKTWVRPSSPGWAEALARLEIALGSPGRALPWAIEACARAPWRSDLVELERACRDR